MSEIPSKLRNMFLWERDNVDLRHRAADLIEEMEHYVEAQATVNQRLWNEQYDEIQILRALLGWSYGKLCAFGVQNGANALKMDELRLALLRKTTDHTGRVTDE